MPTGDPNDPNFNPYLDPTQQHYGFVPYDPAQQANAAYLAGPGQTGGNSGYQNFRYGYTGQPVQPNLYGYGIQPYLDPSGNNIDTKIANDRQMAYSRGSQIGQDLTNWTNYNQGQAGDYQDQLNSAWNSPAAAGYTDQEKNAILNNQALQGLRTSPDQLQSNYLTEGEQQGIQGDPYAPWNYASQAANQLDTENNDFNGTIRTALGNQDNAVNGVLNNTANSMRGAVGNQVNAEMGAYDRGYGETNNAYNQGFGRVQNALTGEQGAVRPYVDPTALNASSDYMQNYQFGPQDQQAIRDQAGRMIGNQEKADEERLQMQANAQGNTNPLALATMRDRLRQTGAINEANAESDAAIKAKQLALQTTQGRENTRLGAAQNYANLGTGTELALGGQNVNAQAGQQQTGIGVAQGNQQAGIGVASDLGAAARGAEQYLGNQQLAGQQYLGSSRIGAEQSNAGRTVSTGQNSAALDVNTLANADAASAARQAATAQNRQAVNQYNQGTQYGQGQYIYGQGNQANQNFANARLGQTNAYTGYLGGQQAQANQNVNVGNQQIGQNFATTGNQANQASGNAITNYKVPGFGQTVFGDVLGAINTLAPHAKGGTIKGPQLALVGEAGPELIVTMADGGMVNPYIDSGEADDAQSGGLPTDNQNVRTSGNPLFKRIIASIAPASGFSTAADVDPDTNQNSYNPYGAGGGPAGQNLLQLGMRAAGLHMAKGGILGMPQQGGHPYGKRGESKMPKIELVKKPEIRILGAKAPQAVVPLTRRPGNKLNVEDMPELMEKFSGRR